MARTWITKVNNVDTVDAAHVNDLQTYKLDKDELPWVRPEDYGAVGDGVHDDQAAIQAAIDSGAARILLSSGTYSYDTGLVIDHAIIFDGAGSAGTGTGTYAGTGTTNLSYTGSGVAITIIGDGVNGEPGFHLSNFLLSGTGAAEGGISFGSGTEYVNYCSLKNICVAKFTKAGAYGLRLKKGYLSYFETVLCIGNYDGVVSLSGDYCTTLKFNNVSAVGNSHNGFYLAGQLLGSSFTGVTSDANGYEGLYIYGGGIRFNDFFGYYSENNQLTGGLAPLVITGSAVDGSPYHNNFFGGVLTDGVPSGYKYIDLDYCERSTFTNVALGAYNQFSIICTNNTNTVSFITDSTYYRSNLVSGNNGGVLVNHGVTAYDSPTFVTANLSNLTDGYIPRHQVPAELVVNGGFDTNTTGWYTYACTIASIAGGQSGNCLELTRVDSAFQYAWAVVPGFAIGTAYEFSVYVKSGTSGNERFQLICRRTSDEGDSQSIIGTSSGIWSRNSTVFTATATSYNVYLLKLSSTAGTMLFDTVSLPISTGLADSPMSTDGTDVTCSGDVIATAFKVGANQVVGAQATSQADLKADYTTGGLDTEAEIIAAINATNAGFNTLLAKLRTHGLIDT